MAKRRARVKLSKAQILENDSNKWQAKKAAAIEQLIKSMAHLKDVERRQRRLDKAVAKPKPKRKAKTLSESSSDIASAMIQGKSFEEAESPPQAKLDDRESRMKAMGFRKTRRRNEKAQSVVTG